MNVREMNEIIRNCDGDQEILLLDSSTGEHLKIEKLCEVEAWSETLAFGVDCKRDPYLEQKCGEIAEKWENKEDELFMQRNWCKGRNLELDAILMKEKSELCGEIRRDIQLMEVFRNLPNNQ